MRLSPERILTILLLQLLRLCRYFITEQPAIIENEKYTKSEIAKSQTFQPRNTRIDRVPSIKVGIYLFKTAIFFLARRQYEFSFTESFLEKIEIGIATRLS